MKPQAHPYTLTSLNHLCFSALLLLGISIYVSAETPPAKKSEAKNLIAHEWGTFTTLHRPNGSQLPWYQRVPGRNFGDTNVSSLPDFVKGGQAGIFRKVMMKATARMETPVIYFYADEPMKVDINPVYSQGFITEFYPGSSEFFAPWKQIDVIPMTEPGAVKQAENLLVDPKLPESHYYEARAVPEACLVRQVQPVDKEGKQAPDQFEKFIFYRGAGSFDSGLYPSLNAEKKLSVSYYQREFALQHAWVLKSDADALRWEKMPAMPTYDTKAKHKPPQFDLSTLNSHASREASVEGLKKSMVGALIDSGLSRAEAEAMIATWDDQWYEEPGQRVFSIVPQGLIDQVLPLTISPKPQETVRVFVHRAEVLHPSALVNLEQAMEEGISQAESGKIIRDAELGRFVFGVLEAVAQDVGQRTTAAYLGRGLQAIRPAQPSADEAKVSQAK